MFVKSIHLAASMSSLAGDIMHVTRSVDLNGYHKDSLWNLYESDLYFPIKIIDS